MYNLSTKMRRFKPMIIKILITVIVALLLMYGFKSKTNRIAELENELYKKQQVDQQGRDTVETVMYTETIKKELNELQEYKVFHGSVTVDHIYNFEDDAIFGFKKRAVLTAACDVAYSINVKLSNATIEESKKRILVTLEKPIIDKESIHRVKDTFVMNDDETSCSYFCNTEDTRRVQQLWEDSLDNMMYDKLVEYYEDDTRSHKMNIIAEGQVKLLISKFVRDKEIIIDIK